MTTNDRQSYLEDAKKGLALIGVKVQKGAFRRLEGVDTLDLGLDVVARALASLFGYPDLSGDELPRIDDVLAYLVARGNPHVSRESVGVARAVLEGIKISTYDSGLVTDQIESLEQAQHALQAQIEKLIRVAAKAEEGRSDD